MYLTANIISGDPNAKAMPSDGVDSCHHVSRPLRSAELSETPSTLQAELIYKHNVDLYCDRSAV